MSGGGGYFASTGAGSPRKPAIVDPRGNIVAVATSPKYAALIVAALNAAPTPTR